jgi:hypothetical protein
MSEQAKAPQTIEPHQAAVEKLLAEASATSSLGVLADHINENPRDESLTLAVQAPQKESQDA